jgi:hypothetical protein
MRGADISLGFTPGISQHKIRGTTDAQIRHREGDSFLRGPTLEVLGREDERIEAGKGEVGVEVLPSMHRRR